MNISGRHALGIRIAAVALIPVTLALAGCLSTKVSTLGPNAVRINLQGTDAPSNQEALKDVMTSAAKETLARDYRYFRFTDWAAGSARTVSPGQPTTANFAVTVVMFREGEQGVNPVFDARKIMTAVEPQ